MANAALPAKPPTLPATSSSKQDLVSQASPVQSAPLSCYSTKMVLTQQTQSSLTTTAVPEISFQQEVAREIQLLKHKFNKSALAEVVPFSNESVCQIGNRRAKRVYSFMNSWVTCQSPHEKKTILQKQKAKKKLQDQIYLPDIHQTLAEFHKKQQQQVQLQRLATPLSAMISTPPIAGSTIAMRAITHGVAIPPNTNTASIDPPSPYKFLTPRETTTSSPSASPSKPRSATTRSPHPPSPTRGTSPKAKVDEVSESGDVGAYGSELVAQETKVANRSHHESFQKHRQIVEKSTASRSPHKTCPAASPSPSQVKPLRPTKPVAAHQSASIAKLSSPRQVVHKASNGASSSSSSTLPTANRTSPKKTIATSSSSRSSPVNEKVDKQHPVVESLLRPSPPSVEGMLDYDPQDVYLLSHCDDNSNSHQSIPLEGSKQHHIPVVGWDSDEVIGHLDEISTPSAAPAAVSQPAESTAKPWSGSLAEDGFGAPNSVVAQRLIPFDGLTMNEPTVEVHTDNESFDTLDQVPVYHAELTTEPNATSVVRHEEMDDRESSVQDDSTIPLSQHSPMAAPDEFDVSSMNQPLLVGIQQHHLEPLHTAEQSSSGRSVLATNEQMQGLMDDKPYPSLVAEMMTTTPEDKEVMARNPLVEIHEDQPNTDEASQSISATQQDQVNSLGLDDELKSELKTHMAPDNGVHVNDADLFSKVPDDHKQETIPANPSEPSQGGASFKLVSAEDNAEPIEIAQVPYPESFVAIHEIEPVSIKLESDFQSTGITVPSNHEISSMESPNKDFGEVQQEGLPLFPHELFAELTRTTEQHEVEDAVLSHQPDTADSSKPPDTPEKLQRESLEVSNASNLIPNHRDVTVDASNTTESFQEATTSMANLDAVVHTSTHEQHQSDIDPMISIDHASSETAEGLLSEQEPHQMIAAATPSLAEDSGLPERSKLDELQQPTSTSHEAFRFSQPITQHPEDESTSDGPAPVVPTTSRQNDEDDAIEEYGSEEFD